MIMEDFIELQNLLNPGPVQIRRVGVDEAPITVRYGSAMYWSQHTIGQETYYKHIVRFYPIDLAPSPIHLASGVAQQALILMVRTLSARFEALVDELAQKDIISQGRREELLGDDWKSLVDNSRLSEMDWEFRKVEDAETELG